MRFTAKQAKNQASREGFERLAIDGKCRTQALKLPNFKPQTTHPSFDCHNVAQAAVFNSKRQVVKQRACIWSLLP